MTEADLFDQWAILELMGHRRIAGHVLEVQVAGAGMLRVDIPAAGDNPAATQYVSPASVYAIHPTTEAIATAAASSWRTPPVTRFELDAARTVDVPTGDEPDQCTCHLDGDSCDVHPY